MSERKRAKEMWDEKMREHKGSTSEADYLYATGKYDEPLPGAREVRYDGSKPSIFNGRKHKNITSALAAVALIGGYPVGNSLNQEIKDAPDSSEITQTEISFIGSAALFDDAEIQATQTTFENMAVNLLVPDQTIVIQHAGSI